MVRGRSARPIAGRSPPVRTTSRGLTPTLTLRRSRTSPRRSHDRDCGAVQGHRSTACCGDRFGIGIDSIEHQSPWFRQAQRSQPGRLAPQRNAPGMQLRLQPQLTKAVALGRIHSQVEDKVVAAALHQDGSRRDPAPVDRCVPLAAPEVCSCAAGQRELQHSDRSRCRVTPMVTSQSATSRPTSSPRLIWGRQPVVCVGQTISSWPSTRRNPSCDSSRSRGKPELIRTRGVSALPTPWRSRWSARNQQTFSLEGRARAQLRHRLGQRRQGQHRAWVGKAPA